MTTKHFNAILAKNLIAKEMAKDEISTGFVLSCLKDIEAYIGEGNQPSVDDSFDNA